MSRRPGPDMPLGAFSGPPRTPEPTAPVPDTGPPSSGPANPGRDRRIYHGACGRWWTGPNRGHCGNCHEVFMPGAFDMHQRINNGVITCSTERLFPREVEWGVLWAQNPDGDGTGYWATRKANQQNADKEQS